MLFRITPSEGSVTPVRIEGEIDMAEAEQFEQELLANLTEANTSQVDMSGVTFIDSSGLRALLRCSENVNGAGPLVIVNPSHFVTSLMRIVGFEDSEHIVLADSRV